MIPGGTSPKRKQKGIKTREMVVFSRKDELMSEAGRSHHWGAGSSQVWVLGIVPNAGAGT